MRRDKLFALLTSAGVALSCASEAARQKARPGVTNEGTNTLVQQGTGTGATAERTCEVGAASLFTEGPFVIEGNTTTVFVDRSRRSISLCQVVLESGKPVAIFQFVGADCIECRDEAAAINQAISRSPNGAAIAHVIIFTDLFSDYQDQAFTDFLTKYAPGRRAFFDEATLWKGLSKDPAAPTRATLLVMSKTLDAAVYNDSGSLDKAVAAADALASP